MKLLLILGRNYLGAVGLAMLALSRAALADTNTPPSAAPPAVVKQRPDSLGDLRKAAMAGDAQAQVALGLVYHFGKGVPVDLAQSVTWFQKAADQGRADGEDFLGRCYYQGSGVAKDMSEANKWFQKSADQGFSEGEYDLGNAYYFGDGTAQDYGQAAGWYLKAANQDHPGAEYNLAAMYAQGQGLQQDYGEANKWCEKAAAQGNAKAEVTMGDVYQQGLGVPVDRAAALKWYTMAAEQDYPDAERDLGGFYYQDAANAPFFYAVGFKWFMKAALHGDDTAEYNVGYSYWKGLGVAKDSIEAAKWYQKAIDQGDADAMYMLGSIYFNGDGLPKDHAMTVKLDLQAAAKGLVSAQFGLGNLYYNGDGVPKDVIEALAWIDIAAASGDKPSLDMRHWLEQEVGEQFAIQAQQRSKELLKQSSPESGSKGTEYPPSTQSGTTSSEPDGYGTGVFVSSDGLILTAAHVIKDAAVVKAKTDQGLQTAQVISVDTDDDVAVLKCEGKFQAVPLRSSSDVKLGQSVFTIGFPDPLLQGFSPKMTRGEISSLMGIEDDPHDWQISVPVQPGNSGGPLFDEEGNIVGLVVSKLKPTAASDAVGVAPEDVNYAVKSSYAQSLLSSYSKSLLPVTMPGKDPEKLEDVVARVKSSVVTILVYESDDSVGPPPSPDSGSPPPSVGHSLKDSSGREYWVSEADYNRLQPMKQALDSLSKQLDQSQADLDNQANKMAAAKASLDDTNQQAVTDYNAQVDQYNSAKDSLSRQTDSFNTSVDNFNAELQKVGQLAK